MGTFDVSHFLWASLNLARVGMLLVVGSSRFHSLAHVLYREVATMLFLASQNFSWEAVPALVVLVVFIIYCSLQDLL